MAILELESFGGLLVFPLINSLKGDSGAMDDINKGVVFLIFLLLLRCLVSYAKAITRSMIGMTIIFPEMIAAINLLEDSKCTARGLVDGKGLGNNFSFKLMRAYLYLTSLFMSIKVIVSSSSVAAAEANALYPSPVHNVFALEVAPT